MPTRESKRALRLTAREKIATRAPVALDTFEALRRDEIVASFEACMGAEWFLLRVMRAMAPDSGVDALWLDA